MKNIINLLCCLLFMIGNSLSAQQIGVKGVVLDELGEPLPGVSISVKGSKTGTVTDMQGAYKIETIQGSILVFSYIGYQTVEKTVNSSTINITMKENSIDVDEVVVTALGIKKEKKALAYSVTEVKGDDLNRVKTANIATGLVGKVAGVNVVKPASGVMGSSRVIIRGNGSLNGNNQPLYIVDGVPITNDNYGQAGMWGGNDGGDGISSISSEDIESMSVLKGGTAAALYGSRASNGAIVITTKKGSAGRVKVEYNMSYTNDRAILKDDFQWEYGGGAYNANPNQLAYNFTLQALIGQGIPESMIPQIMAGLEANGTLDNTASSLASQMGMLSYGSKLDGSSVSQFDGVKRPYVAAGKDNFRNFYENAWSLTNSLSITGGTDKAQYRLSIGDQRYKDLYPNSKLDRNNFTLNLNIKPNEKFSLNANAMYIRERSKNRPNLGDIIMNGNAALWILPANIGLESLRPAVTENGSELLPAGQSWISNPYFVAYNRNQKDGKDRVIASLEAQYNFTSAFYLRGRFGGDMISRRYEDVTPYGTGYRPKGSISNSSTFSGEINAEAMIGYNDTFREGLFGVNTFVGWNTMANWWDTTSAYGQDFVQPGFNTINNTASTSGGHSRSDSYINSIFAQAEFTYRSMLYLTLTGRNDWFSALSYKGKKSSNHIFYPSVGLGFILSEVIDMPSWFQFMKLRGSWAESGGGVGPYNLGLTYNYNQSFGNYPIGSITNGVIPNLNLKPLKSISYEAGFDARFFNNRLGIDFTYYMRNTKDDIVNAGISSSSGYGEVKINAGKVRNQGVEILLTGTPIRGKNFSWNMTYNFAYNKSEVKHITDKINEFIVETARTGHDGDNCGEAYIYHQVGQPYGIIMGVPYKRNENGDIMYKNGIPIKGEVTKLGVSVSPYTMGLSNTFEYKGFQLSFLIDARFGGDLFSMTNARMISFGRHKNTLPGREEGYVIGKGVKEDGITPNDVQVSPMQYYMGVAGITEECIYDASYVKLRELSFGYNFSSAMLNKAGISGLYISVIGRNLWNIYDKVPMVDPESTFNNGNGQGFESYGMPASRSIGFNLNVKF